MVERRLHGAVGAVDELVQRPERGARDRRVRGGVVEQRRQPRRHDLLEDGAGELRRPLRDRLEQPLREVGRRLHQRADGLRRLVLEVAQLLVDPAVGVVEQPPERLVEDADDVVDRRDPIEEVARRLDDARHERTGLDHQLGRHEDLRGLLAHLALLEEAAHELGDLDKVAQLAERRAVGLLVEPDHRLVERVVDAPLLRHIRRLRHEERDDPREGRLDLPCHKVDQPLDVLAEPVEEHVRQPAQRRAALLEQTERVLREHHQQPLDARGGVAGVDRHRRVVRERQRHLEAPHDADDLLERRRDHLDLRHAARRLVRHLLERERPAAHAVHDALHQAAADLLAPHAPRQPPQRRPELRRRRRELRRLAAVVEERVGTRRDARQQVHHARRHRVDVGGGAAARRLAHELVPLRDERREGGADAAGLAAQPCRRRRDAPPQPRAKLVRLHRPRHGRRLATRPRLGCFVEAATRQEIISHLIAEVVKRGIVPSPRGGLADLLQRVAPVGVLVLLGDVAQRGAEGVGGAQRALGQPRQLSQLGALRLPTHDVDPLRHRRHVGDLGVGERHRHLLVGVVRPAVDAHERVLRGRGPSAMGAWADAP